MRKRAKKDANQDKVVAVLRKVGAFVTILSAVGDGCPDILVCFRGTWFPIEIKDGEKVPSKRRLTPEEAAWWLAAEGVGGSPLYIVNSELEALIVIGATAHDVVR